MEFGNVSKIYSYHIDINFLVFLYYFFSDLLSLIKGKKYYFLFITQFLLSGEKEHLLVNKVVSSI